MQFRVLRLEETSSTNDDAKRAAESGEPEGLAVWALRQNAGRGRQGRQWQSPVGNLFCTLLLRPPIPLRDWGHYSFVTALAIHDAVRSFLPHADIRLKWPNDVLVDGKKISGILLEAGEGWLVAGIGINVAHTPENPLYPATSLVEQGAQTTLEAVLSALTKSFAAWYDRFNQEGFACVREAWLHCARKGPMRVRGPSGGTEDAIQGEFADLDEKGNLLLRLADGRIQSFSTGDVFF